MEALPGGVSGGGASVTPTGRRIIALYRGIERDARQNLDPEITALTKLLAR